ncbi:MAG TPA: glycoside hydrolase family 28 protein [Fodinibius sp.]|nr:glycoside hydrolase family 28 protein [Fodinibius sp.]
MRLENLSDKGLRLLCYAIVALPLLLYGCTTNSKSNNPWSQLEEIKAKIKPPTFPDRDCLITDYGAVEGGEILNTDAIALAIQDCYEQGGGRVVVPEGTFLTGAVQLLSNINLHLKAGATLLFSRSPEDYLPMVPSRYEGVQYLNYSPFVYAYDQKNIAITGSGTLDGNASENYWWNWAHEYDDRELLMQMNADEVSTYDRKFGPGHHLRPNFVQFIRSKNILIFGVTLTRSPMWNIHPVLSENITVDSIRIESLGPNNDGVNPESSKNVWIKNSYFDTGDDCIAIKSGRNQDGRRIGVPSENIIIENNQMKDGNGGVVIGSEISGGVRNVFAQNLTMDSPNLERVLRIKTSSKRGGVVENVNIRNIEVGQFREAAIKINMFYGDPGDFMPTVRDVTVENLTVSNGGEYGIMIRAYEESPVQNIRIENTTINSVEIPTEIKNTENLELENVEINGEVVTSENISAAAS